MTITIQDLDKKYGKFRPIGFAKSQKNKGNFSQYGELSYVLSNEEEVFESPVPEGQKLKKKDLYRFENLNTIREYMISNKGVDYTDADDDTLVEDFVDHMRRFNSNVLTTVGEARYIHKADNRTKAVAAEAYNLFDSLGNVFVNDGLYGAVDGVKDYVFSTLTDPTNYLGAATGGFGKAAALGLTKSSKALIKTQAALAGKKIAKQASTQEAAKAAAKAAEAAAKKMISKSASQKAIAQAAQKAAKVAKSDVIFKAAQRGITEFAEAKLQEAGKKAVLRTTALDALFAGLQDNTIQEIYLDVGAQDDYSRTQTALSFALGGVGGGLHYVFGKARGASGLKEALDESKAANRARNLPDKEFLNQMKIINKEIEKAQAMPQATKSDKIKRTRLLNKLNAKKRKIKGGIIGRPLLNIEGQEAATKVIKQEIDTWASKVTRGDEAFQRDMALPESLVKQIMLGEDNRGGLAKLFRDRGMKLRRDTKVTDVMTNVLRFMPEKELVEVSEKFKKYTSANLGDASDLAVSVGELIASDVSRAGKKLSVMSQVRRVIDGGVVYGNEALVETLNAKEVRDTLEDELKIVRRAKRFTYGQNVWKRLLVSSPSTTAANVMGFGQFFAGQGVADIFSSGLLSVAAAGLSTAGKTKQAEELFRKAKVYREIQAQKIKNFFDPYTTRESYLALMDQLKDETGKKDIKGLLFETIGAGVERGAKRYDIDPNDSWFKNTERFANAAMTITGVRIQDTVTKSQMFMTELDKYLRLKKKTSLKEVLKSGKLELIDDDVIGGAVDTTLRSVFSKDYTTNDQALGDFAKFVERASNTPGLGTIIPFGRFMNNVVATAYQWGPVSLLPTAARIAKNKDISSVEALSRSLVGTTGLGLAMLYSEKQEKQGLAFNEINTGGGTIIDVRNIFPMSLFLAVGRAANLKRKQYLGQKGMDIPKELKEDVMAQLAIGQVARDTQFANDLYNVFDFMTGQGDRGAQLDALYKSVGGIAAGATRPLDFFNRGVGYLADNDIAKDVRQARGGGAFTQGATKYFDNILEVLIGETDTITGEKLRVATRQGDIYDANPLARIFGITVKRGRTAAEKVYSMSELKTWTADSRTKIPMYDRIFNESLAPMLEVKMKNLLKDKKFMKGDLQYKRDRVKYELQNARDEVRRALDYHENPGFMDRLRYKASMKGTAEQRKKAKEYLEENGVNADIKDYNFRELNMYNSYIDHLNFIKKGM